MVVDCRNLTEFCKAFEEYRSMTNTLALAYGAKQSSSSALYSRSSFKKQPTCSLMHLSSSSLSAPFCEKSLFAAVDIVILVLVLGVCGFLFTPYLKYLCTEGAKMLPLTLILIGEVVYQAPIVYIFGTVLMFVLTIVAWELIQYKARKCENLKCCGLRNAVEFDIHLESEKCVKFISSSSPSAFKSSFSHEVPWKGSVELGHDHKELEAELKRTAPLNGRAVLVLRKPCGCPIACMEAWGAKKPHKSKK